MTTIDFFPPPVLGHIFELACDSSTLTTACLVRRSWQEPAQRTLFRHLSFRTHRDDRANEVKRRKWKASEAREKYKVQSVYLVVDSYTAMANMDASDGKLLDTLATKEILELCHGIEKLQIARETKIPAGNS